MKFFMNTETILIIPNLIEKVSNFEVNSKKYYKDR